MRIYNWLHYTIGEYNITIYTTLEENIRIIQYNKIEDIRYTIYNIKYTSYNIQ